MKNIIYKLLKWIEKHEGLLLILCLVALLRIPSLFEPARYADEDIYLTIGQNLRRGLVLYKEIFDNKTPLIYYLAAVAGSVSGFRLILLLWNLVNVFFVWKLGEKLLPNRVAVGVATLIFGLFSTLPLLEGEIANGEIFMILPVTLAMYLFLTKTYFWSGVLFATAFLFKTPPLFEMFGLILFILLFQTEGVTNFRERGRRIALILTGFFLPVGLSLIYFYEAGALRDYITSVFFENIPYLSAWGGGSGGGFLAGGLATRGGILVGAIGVIYAVRKKLSEPAALIFLWFVFSLFGALLSGRPYPHYLLQVVTSGALLGALIFFAKEEYTKVVGMGLFFLLAVAVVRYQFWYYKSLPYYQNFAEYVIGKKSREQYHRYWGENVINNAEAAAYIRTVTDETDRIFVWGTEPAIYWLANRQPATKYTTAYHILDHKAQNAVFEELMVVKPEVVVVVAGEKNFSQLSGLLVEKYAATKKFGNLEVYLSLL